MPREAVERKRTTQPKGPGKPHVLALEGELDLRNADRLRADLLAAIDQDKRLRLDLSGVTRADFACVQVLLAAVCGAARRGRPLDIVGLATSPLPALFAALGLIRPGQDAGKFLAELPSNEAAA